jgi:hypothetical protein
MDEASKKLYDLLNKLRVESVDDWIKTSLFTWRWWLALIITIVPWVFWIFFRNKRSSDKLLFIGFFSIIFAFVVDTIGVSFNLWYFEYRMFPVFHIFFPWDFTLIPISIMVLLQIKPNKYLLTKALFFASFSAFIAEPIFHFLKFYFKTNWSYFYSFILYMILYFICDYLNKRKNFEPL